MNHATRKRAALAATLVLAICACGDEGPTMATEFAPELNVDLDAMTRTESGLYYRDLVVGDGPTAEAGQTVVVHYTGWLPDGTMFDTSRDGPDPLAVQIGVGRVIAGWDEGVPGMKVGGRRQLVIPPHLGYGSQGAGGGVIPPDATLVFDIELLDLR
jgi:FKBP-type peptidyl-prolyl cis-trans isomerase